MKKSTTKEQKINERLIKETLNGKHYDSFEELYEAFFPKHFWQNRFTSWQKENDDFFKSFKNERHYLKDNYKDLLFSAIEKQISKKQLSKNFLKNKDDLIFERKLLISNEKIITIYFTFLNGKTIGIAQIISFYKPFNLDWDKIGLKETSSSISCFCIDINKETFKNF